eukprot:5552142-Pyramimonas_sp.AAC.1
MKGKRLASFTVPTGMTHGSFANRRSADTLLSCSVTQRYQKQIGPKPFNRQTNLLTCALSGRQFWSFINSYATLFSLIFEGGLYPVMFMDYMGELLGK